jgi:hypothetical protein
MRKKILSRPTGDLCYVYKSPRSLELLHSPYSVCIYRANGLSSLLFKSMEIILCCALLKYCRGHSNQFTELSTVYIVFTEELALSRRDKNTCICKAL